MGKRKRVIKLLNWIEQYPGFWQMACDPNDEHMDIGKMRIIVQNLAQAGLYEVIIVILSVHKKKDFMQQLGNEVFLHLTKEQIKDGKENEMLKFILEKLE